MMRCVPLLAPLAILLLHSALRGQDKPPTDLDRLQGTWVPSSAVLDGAEAPADLLKDRQWVIAGNQLSELNKERRERRATLVVDGTKKPAAFDMAYIDGDAKGLMGRAIYKLDGDSLTVCMALPGERPTEFASKRGSGLALLVFKRAK
jgi:uncharacterized protein (TIGR03067 family)